MSSLPSASDRDESAAAQDRDYRSLFRLANEAKRDHLRAYRRRWQGESAAQDRDYRSLFRLANEAKRDHLRAYRRRWQGESAASASGLAPFYASPSRRVTFAEAERALRAKAAGTTNPAYQRHLEKFLRQAKRDHLRAYRRRWQGESAASASGLAPFYASPSRRVTFAEAERALRAKAAGTTNPAYQRHLEKFLRLLDWARS